MNDEIIAETRTELSDGVETCEETNKPQPNSAEYPFYIVPRPPIPGKTRWSSTPC